MADLATLKAALARDPVYSTAILYSLMGEKYGETEEAFAGQDGKERTVRVPALTVEETQEIGRIYLVAGHAGAVLAGGGKERADVEKQTAALEAAIATGRPAVIWDAVFRLAIALNASHGGKATADLLVEAFIQEAPRAPERFTSAIIDAGEAVLRRLAKGAGRVLREFGLGGGIVTVAIIAALVWYFSRERRS